MLISRLFIFLMVGAFIAACDGSDKQEGQGGAQNSGNQVQNVDYISVEPVQIENMSELPGRVVSYKSAQIRPQISGIIQERLFEEGSFVEKDQQLYQIDSKPFQAAYDMAKARVREAEAQRQNAQRLINRYQELVDSKAISAQEYDDARAALDQARASVSVAKAELQVAKINLDYTKVYAPISGYIGPSQVTAGALVTQAQEMSLATIRKLDPVYVDLSQSVSEVKKIQSMLSSSKMKQQMDGVTEDVRLDVELYLNDVAAPYPFIGKLDATDISVAQDTGAIKLRTTFENPDMILLPGMFVRAVVKSESENREILVPQKAVQITPDGGHELWVVNDQNKVEKRSVQVSSTFKNNWIVKSGLTSGEKVIVNGTMSLKPETDVQGTALNFNPKNSNPEMRLKESPPQKEMKKEADEKEKAQSSDKEDAS